MLCGCKRITVFVPVGNLGVCRDNAVIERFFGSMKHERLLKAHHLTREFMQRNVAVHTTYYNFAYLYSANRDLSPVHFRKKYPGIIDPYTLSTIICSIKA